MYPRRIVIFAKAPQPGFAKTRLIPLLGAEGAATLARRMLEQTLATALSASFSHVELCVTPDIDSGAWQGITLPGTIEITNQGAGDLGERLARVAKRCIAQGETVFLIGTDCIDMSMLKLVCADVALAKNEAVMYPTVDGGYALLGLKRFDSSIFSGIAWSTDTVAVETVKKILDLGWSIEIGNTLHDIDVPGDLHWLNLNEGTLQVPDRDADGKGCTLSCWGLKSKGGNSEADLA